MNSPEDSFYMVFCKLGHKQAPGTRYLSRREAEDSARALAEANYPTTYYVLRSVSMIGVAPAPIKIVALD